FGVETRFVPVEALRAPDALIGPRTRLLWFESPINPTLRCLDARLITDACRPRGVLSVMDNTFASPVNQQPLALGADLPMQTASKYLNGHSDVTAGVVTGPQSLVAPIAKVRRMLGTVLAPAPAYALGPGFDT